MTLANRAKAIDGLRYYSDEFMTEPDQLRISVPSDTNIQHHLLYAYHNSHTGMHRDRDATYYCLSRAFY